MRNGFDPHLTFWRSYDLCEWLVTLIRNLMTMTAEQTTRIEKMEAELHEQRQIFIQGKRQGPWLRVHESGIHGRYFFWKCVGSRSQRQDLFQKWGKYEGFYWDQEGLLANLYHQILLAIHFEPCAYTLLNQLSMMTNKDKTWWFENSLINKWFKI